MRHSMLDVRRVSEFHDGLQSPLSEKKIRVLGRRLRLAPGQTVLDIGAGTGGPAVILAERFGCRVVAIEHAEEFVRLGRERAQAAGVSELIDYVVCDAAEFAIEPSRYTAAICIGAAWIRGGFAATAEALRDGVPVGGHVAVGDVFFPADSWSETDRPILTLRGMLTAMLDLNLTPVSMAVSSYDDWDDYHSRMMLAAEDWIDTNPDHPAVAQVRDSRLAQIDGALRQREASWALIAARKRRPTDG